MNYTPISLNFIILLELDMGKRPENFEKTLKFLAETLSPYQYAIRGTASLVLQGIDMNVDDIDVVGDSKMALECNEIFKEYLTKPVTYSESPKYKSYFGKFKINDILVEVYGDWQIKNTKGEWVQIDIQRKQLDGLFVTTVETELAMFAAMGRWTAFHKIKNQL